MKEIKVRDDAEQTIKIKDAPATVAAIAQAIINGNKQIGKEPVYYCTIGGKKTAIIE